jgi:signal transduction histidine kinase
MKSAELLDAESAPIARCIAHEFSNLMSIISGYTEFLLEDVPADSPLREHLTEIRSATDRAIELTRRLKQLALDSCVDAPAATKRTR